METMVAIAQTCLTAHLGAWLLLGVRDNIVHPSMNGTGTKEVLELTRLREEYPEDYRLIEGRRVTNHALQRAIFVFIVCFEVLVCLVLWGATLWMALALGGLADLEQARIAALVGTLGFTSIWSGFLIVGNHFAYWYCHQWSQNTHFQMVLWGIGTMVFLAIPQ